MVNYSPNIIVHRSLAAIQSQVRRELEAEKQQAASKSASEELVSKSSTPTEVEASPHLAVQGVYFRCPLISKYFYLIQITLLNNLRKVYLQFLLFFQLLR